ncbi:MAG: hypothetical protein CK530_06605 [Planctomycetaceae bacterium]|nr:MAG: hypothetical protein CK530_12915 [Planctomycetaceae bacterium]PHY02391.1 MAG: hypothetical protein CK530_06605 [Planctomycetaceae bacterium]
MVVGVGWFFVPHNALHNPPTGNRRQTATGVSPAQQTTDRRPSGQRPKSNSFLDGVPTLY